MCPYAYKLQWKPGKELPDTSWKEYYCRNPCVPVDFGTISSALESALQNNKSLRRRQHIWMRPGHYEMSQAVEMRRLSLGITIEKMELPSRSNLDDDDEDNCDNACSQDVVLFTGRTCNKPNEPLFKVAQGTLVLKQIRLQHFSAGVDIWSGNSAIHVAPSRGRRDSSGGDDEGRRPKAVVVLEQCEVTSSSGRGIVCADGGQVHLTDCHVHSCAATGIYLSGEQSFANVMRTDVTGNGIGNLLSGGIARGHSGIYLEEGTASILDCNVSLNTASGISIVSDQEQEVQEQQLTQQLTVANTDIVGNGNVPLDVDHVEMTDFLREGNQLAMFGTWRPRSSLLQGVAGTHQHDVVVEFEEYRGP